MKLKIDKKGQGLGEALGISKKRGETLIEHAISARNEYSNRLDALQSIAAKARNKEELILSTFAFGVGLGEVFAASEISKGRNRYESDVFWVNMDSLSFYFSLLGLFVLPIMGFWWLAPFNLLAMGRILYVHSEVFRVMINDVINKFRNK